MTDTSKPKRFDTIYKGGENFNFVRAEANMFLLHVYYHKAIDTLFLIYKDSKTGKKIMDKIVNPYVPIYVAKQDIKEMMETIPISNTFIHYAPYKDKAKEVQQLLFEPKYVRYKNDWGEWVELAKYPTIPFGAEVLHPRLFLYDVPIEHLVYMEYCMNRYVTREGGIYYEDIKIPEIEFAAFDIETCKDDNGEWYINTNTFVDEKSKTAYIDILRKDIFTNQATMIEDPEQFYSDVKDALYDMIDKCTLKGKTKASVQEYCKRFVDELDIKLRVFDYEEDLIRETSKLMFTTYKPDILMAFNTTYDVGMFNERIEKLNLKSGTFNEQGIGYDDTVPTFTTHMKNGEFVGDMPDPTKREVYLNNISHTMIADYQICYFSNRLGSNFDNYKLMSVAERILGFGKYDYTHITQDITKLAEEDFYFHSIYALIDSILLIMCNHLTEDFLGKLNYMLSSKINMESSPKPSVAIPRGAHTDVIIKGSVPGNNINRALAYMTKENMQYCSNLYGVDFSKLWQTLHQKNDFGGGIVASANLYNFNFKDKVNAKHSFYNEANLSLFRRFESLIYADLKSHYPSTMVTRNFSKGTLYGNITDIKYDNDIIATTNKEIPNHVENLGTVNLSVIDRDPVSFGAVCNGLPDMTWLISKFMNLDSEPKFTEDKYYKSTVDLTHAMTTRDLSLGIEMMKILSDCNTITYNKSETDYIEPDNGRFLLTDGNIWYSNMLVKYKWQTKSLYEYLFNEPVYEKRFASLTKNTVDIDNSILADLKSEPFDPDKEDGWSGWHKVPREEFSKMCTETDIFTYILNLDDGIKIDGNKHLFYFPWKKFLKKDSTIQEPIYRYKKCDKTTKLIFNYTIGIEKVNKLTKVKEELAVTIEQHMQIVNI